MTLKNIAFRHRRPFIIALHLFFVALANYLAFFLRFDGEISNHWWRVFLVNLPVLVAIRGAVFIPFRLYEGLWRYTSIWDLKNIILAAVSSSALFAFTTKVLLQRDYPRSAFLMDPLLLVFMLGGIRVTGRLYREIERLDKARRVLIFGAGDQGAAIVREMKTNRSSNMEPLGFIDDDPARKGFRIYGVRVLGARQDVGRIVAREKPDEVLVAPEQYAPSDLRSLVKVLEPFQIPIRILPNLGDLLDGRVAVRRIRNLSLEDLLARAPVDLDPTPVRHLIEGKRVMVTGAGGSIGSELSRQVAIHRPDRMVLCERYENGLFTVAHDLSLRCPNVQYHAAIVDVTDANRLESIMSDFRPEVVFHAAAHKHVHLMELNPCEAVKNNVTGTRMVAETAARHGVQSFVLISTDKAVNPTSVMGATKRVAELVVQAMDAQSWTSFVTVRFGNVLGSNGSVSEIFRRQIEEGGPVTVTHPDAHRYFMLISEAVQLVLHAAAMGSAGATYVLEMGEQLSVLELARNLIRLHGLTPDRDIAIQYIGLRPGEKLREELVSADEVLNDSPLPNIFRVQPTLPCAPEFIDRVVAQLENSAQRGDARQVIGSLGLLAPDLHHSAQVVGLGS